ncbi:DUF1702 family protein [Actinosynnema sp. CS-041913]|uniref:DUF1702 family protein n=1 Tax=Actinosynnema sp. CS-041913 TaxID=3239917 RepID=UPI003D8C8738
MPTVLGSLRRLVMAPSLADVTFGGRGFPVTPTPATDRLEAIPQAVVCGFEWGIDRRDQWELERRLAMVRPDVLGFAYEGATMACTILDAMRGGRGGKTAALLNGSGRPHIFLAYIGIGFAMARLPRPLWKRVLPELDSPFHPTMSWLAVDGYGFDLAYFHTRRWVDEQRVPAPYPWQGRPDYFPRAVDQGIGRALWFIHGARPDAVADAVRRFAAERRADLWSGVGLAATFAGGCDAGGLRSLRAAAGGHQAELALGMVFAAKARTYAGFVPDHTETAARAFGELSVDAAVNLADATAVPAVNAAPKPADTTAVPGMSSADATADVPQVPPYELWRRNIRAHFPVGTQSRS